MRIKLNCNVILRSFIGLRVVQMVDTSKLVEKCMYSKA